MAKTGYIVPTDARAEYRALIQRANRRILANLKYIKEEGIRDNSLKTHLAGDFGTGKKFATAKQPFSSSVKFSSLKEYEDFKRHVMKWGEDTGRRGGYQADPKALIEEGRSSVYKAVYGLLNNQGISLEKWGGDLPPDLVKEIESMSLQQINKFFEYSDLSGEEQVFDSDSPYEDIEDALEYIRGRISSVQKFFPKATKKKRKSRRKRKGRKKR